MSFANEQLAVMDDLESRLVDRLEDTLLSISDELVMALRRTSYARVPAEGRAALHSVIADFASESIQSAYPVMQRQLGLKAAPTAGDLIREFPTARTSEAILTTTEKQIRNLILGGMTRGEATDVVFADVISRLPDIARVRSFLITRTEVHTATQFTAFQLALRSGIQAVKVWNSTVDDRTRRIGGLGHDAEFDHGAPNGQRVGIAENFLIPRRAGGFEPLLYPGSREGSPGNIINCRCVATYERVS